jgi:ferric-dicitrate binding protein FerR (iron transport regulator)
MGGPKPLEIETPVATAAVKQTEFDLKVQPDGQTTLTVVEGIVEFGTAFGTCPIKTSTISYGNRGKKCTKPAPVDVAPNVAWAQDIRQ